MKKIEAIHNQEFLIELIRPRIEKMCSGPMANIYIIKSEIHNYLRDDEMKPYVTISWSADNHPQCQKIYANITTWDLIAMMKYYREWKLIKLI
jgi:hypothetical protein